MDLIGTAWRVAHNPPLPNPSREPITTAQWPGGPNLPNDPAQLVGSTFHRGNTFDGGRVVQVAANYGTEGALSHWDWTPTFAAGPSADPHLAQWNLLTPIQWDLEVYNDQSLAVRGQATLLQVPSQESAQFTQPGTASLVYG